jgi:hypothetical protein
MLIHAGLVSATAVGLILAGCATTTGKVQPPVGPPAVAQDAACLNQTGSRIPSTSSCVDPGRSYSHDDVSRTGANSAGGALQMLDPAVTVHH